MCKIRLNAINIILRSFRMGTEEYAHRGVLDSFILSNDFILDVDKYKDNNYGRNIEDRHLF